VADEPRTLFTAKLDAHRRLTLEVGNISAHWLGDAAHPHASFMSERPVYYLTLLSVCNDLLRRRVLVAMLVFLSAATALLVVLARPRTYTSSASFVSEIASPRRDREPAFPAREPQVTQPLDPEYYVTLLLSQDLLQAAARTTYTISTPTGRRSGTLADLYGLPPSRNDARMDEAVRRLRRAVELTFPGARIIVVNVRTFDAHLAQSIAARLLELLMEHNRNAARTRAEAQVAFLTSATEEAREEMLASQDRFARFLSANRAFVSASPIALERDRLQAEVITREENYRSLAGALERARAHDTRVTQVISVLDHPEAPPEPDPRGLVRSTLAGAIGGAALAILVVTVGAQVGRFKASGLEELSELSARWRAAVRIHGATRDQMGEHTRTAAREGA
jgi:uncharacterized protein involved in exopolysaccharide biosynthesis